MIEMLQGISPGYNEHDQKIARNLLPSCSIPLLTCFIYVAHSNRSDSPKVANRTLFS